MTQQRAGWGRGCLGQAGCCSRIAVRCGGSELRRRVKKYLCPPGALLGELTLGWGALRGDEELYPAMNLGACLAQALRGETTMEACLHGLRGGPLHPWLHSVAAAGRWAAMKFLFLRGCDC